MNANKLLATIVVGLMVFSTVVVMDQLKVIGTASAQPGVDEYGMATSTIVYGQSYASGSIKINTSMFTGGTSTTDFYLYYPVYLWYNSTAHIMSWEPFYINNDTGNQPFVTGIGDSKSLDTGGAAITFNRSGMWIFDMDLTHDPTSAASFQGYIWVNTSTVYTIESVSDITYNESGSLTITVDTKGDAGCMIAIMDPQNNTIYNRWRSNGQTEELDYHQYLTSAGTYTLKAYRDKDTSTAYKYPDEKYTSAQYSENYSALYGSDYTGNFPTGIPYDFGVVGPWNPPERNATEITFKVKTASKAPYLNIVLSNTSFYWGYRLRIDVNVTNATGDGIDLGAAALRIKKGRDYFDATDVWINDTTLGNYTIELPRYTDNPGPWDNISAVTNANGSWSVVFAADVAGTTKEEWNGTASFSITGASPPVQLVIDSPTKKKIEFIPAYTPLSGHAGTTVITFTIFGRSITDEGGRAYYGDDTGEDVNNITVSGDLLYPVTPVHITKGTWTATVTPTKPGGTITLAVDWPGDDNGSASQTLDVVNGTTVTPSATKFTVGSDYNLTVTVVDIDGDPVKTANVYLMWENDAMGQFNMTTGDNTVGNGKNGEYTFWIIVDDDTPSTAPQNLTIAAQWATDYWGYALVIMDRNHDMTVNCTPTSSYAGNSTSYNITIGRTGGGHPGDLSQLTVAIYNETGELVGAPDAWSVTGEYSILNEEIILSGGVYHIYAYNNTHDSAGNNATITVTKYAVTTSPSTLAWKIDQETNITFQVTPAYSGILTLLNISSSSNGSDVGASTTISIDNGVGTLEGFNATTLGNITYTFAPDDGDDRPADGLTRITTATATPVPANIYINEATTVIITVTHPATNEPISGVWISLDNDKDQNSTILAKIPSGKATDAAGQVSFALNAQASGNITIFIENQTDPDNAFVIVAGGRLPMSILLTSPSANEGSTFTADIKSGSTLVTGVTVTVTFAGTTTTTTDGHVTLTAPSVTTNLPYTITATALGYSDATAQVTILNVPKLIIAVLTSSIKAGQDFQVAVADDTGTAIIGATVTVQGQTVHTGAGGVATLKAPSTAGNYTVTATFGAFEQATQTISVGAGGGIPGFELVTLLVAAGIAFLLIRRRRN